MTNNTKKLRRFMRQAREDALSWAAEESLDNVIAAEKHMRRELWTLVRRIRVIRQILSHRELNTPAWRSKALALAKAKKRAAMVAGYLAGYRKSKLAKNG